MNRNRSKYRNNRVNGFDSQKEAQRYAELCLMQRAGMIDNLQRQVKFVLIPTQREPDTLGPRGRVKRGKVIFKETSYYADFVYYKGGKMVVEDCKGFRTKEYMIKRKLMYERHGVLIYET